MAEPLPRSRPLLRGALVGGFGALIGAALLLVLQATILAAPPEIVLGSGWTIAAGEGAPRAVEVGDPVAPGDILGLSLTARRRAHVYALSVFRYPGEQASHVVPCRAHDLPQFQAGRDLAFGGGDGQRAWGLSLAEGEHHVAVAVADEDSAFEGLLVLVSPHDEPALETWLDEIEGAIRGEPSPRGALPLRSALALLAAEPRGDRTWPGIPDEDLREMFERWRRVSPEQLAGLAPWPLEEVQRFDLSLRVQRD